MEGRTNEPITPNPPSASRIVNQARNYVQNLGSAFSQAATSEHQEEEIAFAQEEPAQEE